ncbi:hypothetical protein NXS19_002281 [Fusarium pseudograminearum]|nr:hypothetical protein NXS19_002281 [Fusarium pseudograminearum]
MKEKEVVQIMNQNSKTYKGITLARTGQNLASDPPIRNEKRLNSIPYMIDEPSPYAYNTVQKISICGTAAVGLWASRYCMPVAAP